MPLDAFGATALVGFGLIDWTGLVDPPLATDCWALVLNSFAPLANPIRRKVLVILTEEGPSDRERLAERLAADADVEDDDAADVALRLHHVHLPKLDAHHYVEYDPRMGDVVLWDPATA